MKPIIKSIEINAPREKVWSVLWDKANYQEWSKSFNAVWYMEWKISLGEKIRFLGPDPKTGEIGGLLCEITELVPNEVIVFTFLWWIVKGAEITDTPEVQSWVGLKEQYHLTESNGITKLDVATVMEDQYHETMDTAWKNAMVKIKEMSETGNN